jgi:hypothetical protein
VIVFFSATVLSRSRNVQPDDDIDVVDVVVVFSAPHEKGREERVRGED